MSGPEQLGVFNFVRELRLALENSHG
jgi:hypothetical protein